MNIEERHKISVNKNCHNVLNSIVVLLNYPACTKVKKYSNTVLKSLFLTLNSGNLCKRFQVEAL